ncbi:AMIN-like domain-containing (lipo)protein [Kitasatospora sp. HPMI-4]|uniref:AMIN-like domain-containing (lipo)protein n=1 Tax=Kitasatospora sp. HPMI-4 TaxID=3448443 RepID=UPI003F1E29B2
MRRWITVPAVLALAAAGTAVVPATASAATRPAAASQCATDWGSLPKSDRTFTSNQLVNVRTGQNPCYDRMVLDVPGVSDANRIGYQVRYVDELLQQASGTPIPVSGGAVLEIVVTASTMDFGAGKPSYPGQAGQPLPGVDLTGYRTFTDARFAGSHEGYTQLGLGVRARLPFRVFQLDNRVVVDVAHDWGTAG